MSFFGGRGPGIPGDDDDKSKISSTRIIIWLLVAGVGAYLIITGIVGIVAKG